MLFGIIIDVNDTQFSNALVLIVVTVVGIIIDVVGTLVDSLIDINLLQPKNMLLEIVVKFILLLGNFTYVNSVQNRNALEPILVTESGIVSDVNEVQLWNALEPIVITEFGIVSDVNEL